jgi:hypothetical protein
MLSKQARLAPWYKLVFMAGSKKHAFEEAMN